MARRAELTVDASRGELAEEILIKIALGVTLRQRKLVDHVDCFDEECGLLDHQLGVFHEFSEDRSSCCGFAEMGKHLIAHQGQHYVSAEMTELRPTQFLLIVRKAVLKRLLSSPKPAFVPRLADIQQTGMPARPISARASATCAEGCFQHWHRYRLQHPQHAADRQLRELVHHQELVESIARFAIDVAVAGCGGHVCSLGVRNRLWDGL